MTHPLDWGRGNRTRIATRDIPAGVLALVIERQGGRWCEECRALGLETPSDVPLEADHKQPLSCGGDNHHLNLRLLCESHNRSRKNKPINDPIGRPRWERRRRA